LGRIISNLDVTRSEGQAIPLFEVFFKEESNLAVALLLEIADDRSAAKLAFAKNFFDFKEIFALQSQLKKVVGIVNSISFRFALTVQHEDLVFHKL
jgi:hypothetical protein